MSIWDFYPSTRTPMTYFLKNIYFCCDLLVDARVTKNKNKLGRQFWGLIHQQMTTYIGRYQMNWKHSLRISIFHGTKMFKTFKQMKTNILDNKDSSDDHTTLNNCDNGDDKKVNAKSIKFARSHPG